MATDLVATPLNTEVVVPNGMAINPVLDWAPILGVPVWVPLSIIFFGGLVLVNLYWLMRVGRLSNAVGGWIESMKNMSQDDAQVWVISRIQKLTIECMTIKDNVLSSHDPLNIGMWYVSSPMGVIRIGGQRAVVISEDFDRNRDIISEIALCFNLDNFNRDLESLKAQSTIRYQQQIADAPESERKQIEKPKIMKPIEKFQQFSDYGRSCLTLLYPSGLETPSYGMYFPNRFRKYFPTGNTSTHFGGECIMEARDMNIDRREKGFWEVHAMLIGAVVIVLIGIIGVAFFPIGA